jgi:hypothetical protein
MTPRVESEASVMLACVEQGDPSEALAQGAVMSLVPVAK